MDYAAPERRRPVGSASDAWKHYWQASIADAGLELTPIYEGSWFVHIAQLEGYSTLIAFLKAALAYCGVENPETVSQETLEAIGPPLGGYALRIAGKHFSEPGCCSDLSNIDEWQQIVEQRPQDWSHPWNGHGSAAGELRIRFTAPYYLVDTGAGKQGEVVQEDFEKAVQRAYGEVLAFRYRLQTVAGTLVPKEMASHIVRILTEGHR